ncbi:MAG: helix-turn-helix transcriptional regulator [Clostridiales bacterium]|nr:helix-turn-helix transcriptional regulator [Clostridiales bacterium]
MKTLKNNVLPIISFNYSISTDGEKLLQVLSNGMQLSSSEIAEKIGWSKDKTIRTLNNLKSSGYIEVFGKGRCTKYSKR